MANGEFDPKDVAPVEGKIVPVPVPPLPVVVVGTGNGGVGSPLVSGVVAKTPDHLPDISVVVISPVIAIGIRFVNTFLTALVGILTGAMATNMIPADDFVHLLYKCAGLSVAGAVVGLLKDAVTIFSRLETSHPLATGNV